MKQPITAGGMWYWEKYRKRIKERRGEKRKKLWKKMEQGKSWRTWMRWKWCIRRGKKKENKGNCSLSNWFFHTFSFLFHHLPLSWLLSLPPSFLLPLPHFTLLLHPPTFPPPSLPFSYLFSLCLLLGEYLVGWLIGWLISYWLNVCLMFGRWAGRLVF